MFFVAVGCRQRLSGLDDLPDRWTLLGAALLIGSGLYIFYRESRYSAKLPA